MPVLLTDYARRQILLAGTAGSSGPLLQDNFPGGAGQAVAGTTLQTGQTWQNWGGFGQIVSDGSGGAYKGFGFNPLRVAADSGATTYTATVDFVWLDVSGGGQGGLIFRGVDSLNYFIVIVDAGLATITLNRVVAGDVQEVGSEAYTPNAPGTDHLQVYNTPVGSAISINGLDVFTNIEATFGEGTFIGLSPTGLTAAAGSFHNFLVSP